MMAYYYSILKQISNKKLSDFSLFTSHPELKSTIVTERKLSCAKKRKHEHIEKRDKLETDGRTAAESRGKQQKLNCIHAL